MAPPCSRTNDPARSRFDASRSTGTPVSCRPWRLASCRRSGRRAMALPSRAGWRSLPADDLPVGHPHRSVRHGRRPMRITSVRKGAVAAALVALLAAIGLAVGATPAHASFVSQYCNDNQVADDHVRRVDAEAYAAVADNEGY